MPSASLPSLLLVPAVLLGAAPPSTPPPPAPALPAEEQPVAILFQVDPADRMTVPIGVAGSGPHPFVVDTGAERSAVSRELAAKLHLPGGPSRIVISFGSTELVPTVTVSHLEFARAKHEQVLALTFSRDRIGAEGFLGIDALTDKLVTFNFNQKRMSIRRAPRFSDQSAYGFHLDAKAKAGRLLFQNVIIDGVKVTAILDTGSSVSIGNAAMERALKARGKMRSTVPVWMLPITGPPVKVDYGIARNVMLEDVGISNLPIAFSVTEPFARLGLQDKPAMLLGMDGLRAFQEVAINFRSKQVRFVPRDMFARSVSFRG